MEWNQLEVAVRTHLHSSSLIRGLALEHVYLREHGHCLQVHGQGPAGVREELAVQRPTAAAVVVV